jgi:hypothetical protein
VEIHKEKESESILEVEKDDIDMKAKAADIEDSKTVGAINMIVGKEIHKEI